MPRYYPEASGCVPFREIPIYFSSSDFEARERINEEDKRRKKYEEIIVASNDFFQKQLNLKLNTLIQSAAPNNYAHFSDNLEREEKQKKRLK